MTLDDLAFDCTDDLTPWPLHWEEAREIITGYLERAQNLVARTDHLENELRQLRKAYAEEFKRAEADVECPDCGRWPIKAQPKAHIQRCPDLSHEPKEKST